jgi:hypothetical protein
MNSNLMRENIEPYRPYIQLLYCGLEINGFNFSYTKDLYRSALIKKVELQNIISHLKKKIKSNIPCGLVQSRTFMSFSFDKDIAMNFLKEKIEKLKKDKEKREKEVGVLYILKAEVSNNMEQILIQKNATNADLTDISYYGNEKEILLFPFSIYEISDIQKKGDYYIIYLNILIKYKQNLDFKNQSDLNKLIFESKYVKKLLGKGLLQNIMYMPKIVVHFISTDSSVNFSWVCNITDIFLNIEENLYHKYPHLKNNIYFLANGNMIDRSNTLEQNRIKDDDVILICFMD